MNRYVQFQVGGNWRQFLTMAKDWVQVDNQPSSVRSTLLGTADVTFAPTTLKEWRGTIEIPVTPQGVGWGSVADFAAVVALRAPLQFIDHYGTQYTVAVVGPEFIWKSFKPMWDAASNKFHIPIRIVKVA